MRAGNRIPQKPHKTRRSGSGRVSFIAWYHSLWFIALMMLIFPLVGIILILTSPYKTRTKVIATVIAAIYMGIGAACMYYFGEFNRHTLSRRLFSFDFKYSKQGGDSKFDFVAERGEKVGYSIPVLIYVIISAIAFPFTFFFSFYVKIGFALAVLIISPIIQLIGEAKEMSQKIKNDLYRSEFEKKELDAQKKREEMGKWK